MNLFDAAQDYVAANSAFTAYTEGKLHKELALQDDLLAKVEALKSAAMTTAEQPLTRYLAAEIERYRGRDTDDLKRYMRELAEELGIA
jgi:hypothetical protein